MHKIGIVILNYKGYKNTLECLESLLSIEVSSFKILIIVVDNASPDNNQVFISDYISDIKRKNLVDDQKMQFVYIENNKNLGFAGGNNVGIRYAIKHGAEYVVVLNNDTIVDKNFLGNLVDATKHHDRVGLYAPKIYFAPGFEYHKDRYKEEERGKVIWYAGGKIDWNNVLASHRGVDEVDSGQYDKVTETDFATGCCMMVSKEVLEKVGLIDEKYFLYYEDSDYSLKIRRAGYKILYIPSSVIWHKNAGSTGGSGSNLQDYYTTRNRILFANRYAPFRAKFALFRQNMKMLFTGRKYQREGVLDYYFGKLGKGTYHE